MKVVNLTSKSDFIGVMASSLCFVHCIATPLLFVAQAGSAVAGEVHPWWWGTLDLTFLLISFFAVYWSARKTSKKWVRYAFWGLWGALALIIINEKLELWRLAEEVIYLPTIGLIFLHFYNRRYCQCEDEHCCADHITH
ncbi:MerC family mercury resistance protein [Flavobacteriaceae bacterium R33]|uniref:MerC family mercury resistance protein n=2 Tax=Poritiphilus flavus TaxID=2697053 RepID=A0A6L9E7L5_9FLAO|nr:MerC family mercury resistance protein [Poritiphilus flavus]